MIDQGGDINPVGCEGVGGDGVAKHNRINPAGMRGVRRTIVNKDAVVRALFINDVVADFDLNPGLITGTYQQRRTKAADGADNCVVLDKAIGRGGVASHHD